MKWIWAILSVIILTACASPTAEFQPQTDQPTEQPADDKQAADLQVTDTPTEQPATVEPERVRADLTDYGPAPELENEVWLNTSESLRLGDLRGKVVLLEMWTFG